MKERKFEHGQIVMTKAVAEEVERSRTFSIFIGDCLIRHLCGDWGDDLTAEDVETNQYALKNGGRLFSAYIFRQEEDIKVWIITEGDRSVTTILFPSDY